MYIGVLIGFVNNHQIDRDGLLGECLEEAKVGVDQGSVQWVEFDVLEPGESFVGKESSRGGFDQPACQHRVDSVANGRALIDQGRAAGGEGTFVLDVRRGHPDARKVIAAQELGQDQRIDLVGFDIGLGDGLGLHGVGDDDVGDVGLDESDEGPGVAGDFDGEAVGGQEVNGGELADRVGVDGKDPDLSERPSCERI